MSAQRLNEIGHILIGAGSDSSRMYFNSADIQLLDIKTDQQVEETYAEVEVKDGKITSVEKTRKQAAAIAVQPPEGMPIKIYSVNVGIARKALKVKLAGRPIDNILQPDAPMPVTEEPA